MLAAGVSLVMSVASDAAGLPRLYVFANADMRAHALENELEAVLPGVDVVVFSRIRGFEEALLARPEAVLAPRQVLEGFGLKPELQGYRGAKATEPYVLISNNVPLTPGDLQGRTLGTVDVLGRRKMEEFVAGVLGVPAPRLKHVTHERDLLALLQFDAVAAVLTSERWSVLLREKSEMNLRTTLLKNEVGLAAVAFHSPQAKNALESKIKSAGARLNNALGVTQWR